MSILINATVVAYRSKRRCLYAIQKCRTEESNIYVDFKNWQESTDFDWSKQINKIGLKAEKCGCKCVIIANIVADRNYKISSTTKNGVEILVIPSLLLEHPVQTDNVEAWRKIKECIDRYGDKN